MKKLNGNQFISSSRIHRAINGFDEIGKMNLKDMHHAFEKLWENMGFGENQEIGQIILELTSFIKEFYSKHSNEKEDIEKLIIEIPNHNFKDKSIEKIIEHEDLRELLHETDEEILFDAHEYAGEHPEIDLCFISWDDNFIKTIKILLNQLSFKKYIGRYESKIK